MVGGREAKQLWGEYFASRSVAIRNRLVEMYRPLVHIRATKLSHRLSAQISFDEICSAGYDGLIESVESFDPDKGASFNTFCQRRIHGAVMDWLRSFDGQSRTVRTFEKRRNRTRDEIVAMLGRQPSERELAYRMGLGSEQYSELSRVSRAGMAVHVSAVANEDDDEREWSFRDHHAADPSEREARRSLLARIMRGLSKDEQAVLKLYYIEGISMAEIGRAMDLSESRVSQIHKEVMARLRACPRLKADVAADWRERTTPIEERTEDMFEGDDKGLEHFVSELDQREQRIIIRKHDLDGNGKKSAVEIGKDEGISDARVYQLHGNAMTKLRQMRERASGKRPAPKAPDPKSNGNGRALARRTESIHAAIEIPGEAEAEGVIAHLEKRRQEIDLAIATIRSVYGIAS